MRLRAACLIALLASSGCASPAGTAARMAGRWESGRTQLICTPHGLYGLRHESRTSAGRFALPSADQVLVEQVAANFSARNLWDVTMPDADHLNVKLPDGHKLDFSRAKPAPPAEPHLVGLWQAPSGLTRWNFYEFNADGSYLELHWLRGRGRTRRLHRRLEVGTFRCVQGSLHLDRQADASRVLGFTLNGDSLTLKTANGKGLTFQRAPDASHLGGS